VWSKPLGLNISDNLMMKCGALSLNQSSILSHVQVSVPKKQYDRWTHKTSREVKQSSPARSPSLCWRAQKVPFSLQWHDSAATHLHKYFTKISTSITYAFTDFYGVGWATGRASSRLKVLPQKHSCCHRREAPFKPEGRATITLSLTYFGSMLSPVRNVVIL